MVSFLIWYYFNCQKILSHIKIVIFLLFFFFYLNVVDKEIILVSKKKKLEINVLFLCLFFLNAFLSLHRFFLYLQKKCYQCLKIANCLLKDLLLDKGMEGEWRQKDRNCILNVTILSDESKCFCGTAQLVFLCSIQFSHLNSLRFFSYCVLLKKLICNN